MSELARASTPRLASANSSRLACFDAALALAAGSFGDRARLQLRAAAILQKQAQQAGFGGAAVVLDVQTDKQKLLTFEVMRALHPYEDYELAASRVRSFGPARSMSTRHRRPVSSVWRRLCYAR